MSDTKYPDIMNFCEVSKRTGAQRVWTQYGDHKRVMYGGSFDDPYWDVPPRAVDVDEPIYEQISREMIHDTYGCGTPLDQFIDEVRALAAKGKKGCPVFVKYDKDSDYEGGYYYYFEVGYERPPTKAERKQREEVNRLVAERDVKLAEKAAEAERQTFERLKAKFDSDSDTRPKDGDAKQGSTRE